MRVIAAMSFVLLLSVSGLAQTTTAAAVYGDGVSAIDNAGNLYVFDSGRSTTAVTVTGLRRSFFAPKTRVTVQRQGSSGNTQTVEFDGEIRVIGVGTAVFAIATVFNVSGTTVTTTQSLIAIQPTLPTGPAVLGFPSMSLTSPVEAKVNSSDFISVVTLPERSSNSARTASVVHFNGNSFDVVSTGTLP
jgi:hypothetical protein